MTSVTGASGYRNPLHKQAPQNHIAACSFDGIILFFFLHCRIHLKKKKRKRKPLLASVLKRVLLRAHQSRRGFHSKRVWDGLAWLAMVQGNFYHYIRTRPGTVARKSGQKVRGTVPSSRSMRPGFKDKIKAGRRPREERQTSNKGEIKMELTAQPE